MAIRLALVAHHYRADWEWTANVLAQAQLRLERWRAAVAPARAGSAGGRGPGGRRGRAPSAVPLPTAAAVLATVRERLADDLDAPGAVAAIDAWAEAVLASPAGATPAEAALVRDTADALLGVSL